jgi:hypothetical protein
MNCYKHKFAVTCPNNGKQIFYDLEIQATEIIFVEKIIIACELWQSEYHEKIADGLIYQFPNTKQILKAVHDGVEVETIRGTL